MSSISLFENGGGNGLIPVEWHDCAWVPRVRLLGARTVRLGPIKTLPATPLLRHPAGRKSRNAALPFASRNMPARFGGCDQNIPDAQINPNIILPHSIHSTFSKMKNHPTRSRRFDAGFTLVELLVVIAIIAILAAMLLPVLAHVKLAAYKKQTQIQVNDIATAIQGYDSTYGRFPISPAAQAAANADNNADPFHGKGDITYCGTYTNAAGLIWPPAGPTASTYFNVNGNADVISTLMDFTNYPNSIGYPGFTVNTNYQKNPQKTQFLNAKMSGWDPTQPGTPSPGVGSDLVYRDIWGNPFIISMDANYDGQCQDAFYGLASVSKQNPGSPQGLNGLINTVDPTGARDYYRFHGTVMVWSMGPYGPATPAASAFDLGPATDAANKGHIASWQ